MAKQNIKLPNITKILDDLHSITELYKKITKDNSKLDYEKLEENLPLVGALAEKKEYGLDERYFGLTAGREYNYRYVLPSMNDYEKLTNLYNEIEQALDKYRTEDGKLTKSIDEIEELSDEHKEFYRLYNKLSNQFESGLLSPSAVAFITKGFVDKEGVKVYSNLIAIGSDFLIRHNLIPTKEERLAFYKKTDPAAIEKVELFARILSALAFHEFDGHGVYGHLVNRFNVFDSPVIDNIIEDLFINTILQRKLPKAGKDLKSKLSGVFSETQYTFPNIKKYYSALNALLNIDKNSAIDGSEKQHEIVKNASVELQKIIADSVDAMFKNGQLTTEYNLRNEQLNKLLEDLYKTAKENPTQFIKKYIEVISTITKAVENPDVVVNYSALHKLIINFNSDLQNKIKEDANIPKILRAFMPKNAQQVISMLENAKRFESINIDFDNIFEDGVFKEGEDDDSGNEPKGPKGPKGPRKSGEEPIGPYEDPEFNLDDIDDDYLDEIDEETYKKEDERLKNQENKTREEIDKMFNKKRGTSPGNATEKGKYDINAFYDEIEEILKTFEAELGKTFLDKRFSEETIVPRPNDNNFRNHIMNAKPGDPYTVILGDFGKMPRSSNNKNILYAIFDISGSMHNVFDKIKSAMINSCSKFGANIIAFEGDTELNDIKILNTKDENKFEKHKEKFMESKGFGGTNGHYEIAASATTKLTEAKTKLEKQIKEKLTEKRKDYDNNTLLDELNLTPEQYDEANKVFALFTDNDTFSVLKSTPDEALKKIVEYQEKQGGENPVMHIFVFGDKSMQKENIEAIKNAVNSLRARLRRLGIEHGVSAFQFQNVPVENLNKEKNN